MPRAQLAPGAIGMLGPCMSTGLEIAASPFLAIAMKDMLKSGNRYLSRGARAAQLSF